MLQGINYRTKDMWRTLLEKNCSPTITWTRKSMASFEIWWSKCRGYALMCSSLCPCRYAVFVYRDACYFWSIQLNSVSTALSLLWRTGYRIFLSFNHVHVLLFAGWIQDNKPRGTHCSDQSFRMTARHCRLDVYRIRYRDECQMVTELWIIIFLNWIVIVELHFAGMLIVRKNSIQYTSVWGEIHLEIRLSPIVKIVEYVNLTDQRH